MKMQTRKILNKMEEDPYYISSSIKKQLLRSIKIIKEANQDRVFIITGREGSGKSLLAMQLAWIIDNNFNLDDIAFVGEQFSSLIKTTKKKVAIFDEAFNGLSSKGAISKQNKAILRTLIECRQRNLIVFIVLPSIFLLEKYLVLYRSQALFHTAISKKNYKNRFYKVYNYSNKKLLYIYGHKFMSYSKPFISKKHRFYGKYPPTINEKEYEKKKLLAFQDRVKEEVPEVTRQIKQRDKLIYYMNTELKVKQTAIAGVLNCQEDKFAPQQVSKIVLNQRKLHKTENNIIL